MIDDSALDYEEDEESSIAINPADEDTLLGEDDDEVITGVQDRLYCHLLLYSANFLLIYMLVIILIVY